MARTTEAFKEEVAFVLLVLVSLVIAADSVTHT
jgi:hypothetical protein